MLNKLFLETVELKTVEDAQKLLNLENARKKRLTAALLLSAIASVMIILGLFGMLTLGGLGVILAIPAYIMGGFGSTLISLLKMILFGWSIMAFMFPINLLPAALMATLGAFLLMCVPVFFIGINYKQHQKNIEEAQLILEKSANESPVA